MRPRGAGGHPRVPAHLARHRPGHVVPDAALRPDAGRRAGGRLRLGRAAAGGGRGDRRGAARLGGPRPHRPHRDLPRGRGHRHRRPCPSTPSTSTPSRRTATRCSSPPGTPARSTASTGAPARCCGASAGGRATSRCPTGASSVAARPASPARRHAHALRQPRQRHRDRLRVRRPALRAGRGDDDRHPRAGAAVPGPLRLRDGQRPAPRRRARARRVGDGSLRHRVRRHGRGGLRAVGPRARLLPVLPLPVARSAR